MTVKIQQITEVLAGVKVLLLAGKEGSKVVGSIETYSPKIASAFTNHDTLVTEDGTILQVSDREITTFSYDLVLFTCKFEAEISDLGDGWSGGFYE